MPGRQQDAAERLIALLLFVVVLVLLGLLAIPVLAVLFQYLRSLFGL